MRRAAIGAVLLAVAAACGGGDDDEPGAEGGDRPGVRLDQVQVVATHNSYHLEPPEPILTELRALSPQLAESREYSHPPLAEQLDEGVRGIELDVYEDAEGGRFAEPRAVERFGLDPLGDELRRPGFKVLHDHEIDYRSTCPTFRACLQELADWSEAHAGHLPVVVQLEVKDRPVPDLLQLGFAQPVPATAETFRALEDEIREVFAEDDVVRPADVQRGHPTLRTAVEADGWPLVHDLRGRVLFVLDDHDAKRDLYRGIHPDTRDRLLFVDARPPHDDAAYAIANDPVAEADVIRALVETGFLVRTRADADTVEARAGDRTRAEAALASGAQVITTDYPVEDPRRPGYVVRLPRGGHARCNPVSAPPGCEDSDLEP